MKKRLIAALTALCCAGTMTLSVSAYDYAQKTIGDEAGKFMAETSTKYGIILVETDGTELTEELLGDLGHEYSVYLAEEWYEMTAASAWSSNNIRNYEIPENSYIISLNAIGQAAVNMQALANSIGRDITAEYSWIEDAHAVSYTEYVYCSFWGVIFECKDDTMELNAEIIPELSDYQFNYAWDGAYSCVLPDCYAELPYGTTDYAEFEMHRELFNSVFEQYSDILEDMRISTDQREGGPADLIVFEDLTPIWQTAGDHNADGEVNSNDAADLLVQAAQDGVAEASAAAVSPDSDVNLDGVADSTDAAYILQYAALKGSGADADWVEILRK